MGRKLKIAVVFGGRSAEHEVSIESARNVLDALDRSKYEPVVIGIDRTGRWLLHEESALMLSGPSFGLLSQNRPDAAEEVTLVRGESGGMLMSSTGRPPIGDIDAVFPVLHGPYGEDGSVQGLFRLAGIPYVGAGVLGSAVGMDKDVAKRLLRDAGIPVADFIVLTAKNAAVVKFSDVSSRLGGTVFVKPANLGSSVGVSKARTAEEFEAAVRNAFQYDTKVLVEEFVRGREIECSVIGTCEEPEASVPGEILPSHDFYDYEAKYLDENGAVLKIPADVDPETADRIRSTACATFTALCADGMARVDFFLREDGSLVVNEINTIPGFTKISMFPMLWKASGLSYPALVDRLVELAMKRCERERALRTRVF